ncbi:MAG TPA: hypothetical protein VEN79_03095 [Terriglobia bacterium]|nr:hypothetical protein [Terriglobia bacterium]
MPGFTQQSRILLAVGSKGVDKLKADLRNILHPAQAPEPDAGRKGGIAALLMGRRLFPQAGGYVEFVVPPFRLLAMAAVEYN